MNEFQHLAAALAVIMVGFLLYTVFFAMLISMIPTKVKPDQSHCKRLPI